MVSLDARHARAFVEREIDLYAPLVSRGSYLVVEDGNVDGNPVRPNYVEGPDVGGPSAAIDAFLARDDRFVVDRAREKFLMTFNPRGFLRRIK